MERADQWLKICIALGAFGSLRRGEIAALRYGDLDGNVLHVHADVVRGSNGEWVHKEMPKTNDSVRDVPLPAEVVTMLGSGEPDDLIIPEISTPNRITDQFSDLRDSLGLKIRFHDLRHYYASISAALGIPQSYTERTGGWHPGSPIMKEIYQNPIAQFEEKFANQLLGHFGNILDSEK
jgi:integrase